MTIPRGGTSNLSGKPPVVDRAGTWQAARDELLGSGEGTYPRGRRDRRGPSPAADGRGRWRRQVTARLAQSRSASCSRAAPLVRVPPHVVRRRRRRGTVRGLHVQRLAHAGDGVYRRSGVLFAVLTAGRWEEVAPLRRVHGVHPAAVLRAGCRSVLSATEEATLLCYLRDGDRVFLTYAYDGPWQRARGCDSRPARHDAVRPPRGVGGQPGGRPAAPQAGSPGGGHGEPICWYWRTDDAGVASWGPTSLPDAAMDSTRGDTRPVARPDGRPPLRRVPSVAGAVLNRLRLPRRADGGMARCGNWSTA